MFPFKSHILINRATKTPIFQQIANQLIVLIQEGKLGIGQKLLSSREMSQILGVHRKTITQVFEDLASQGWLESKVGSGTFVAKDLPQISPQILQLEIQHEKPKTAGFPFEKKKILERTLIKSANNLHLDDGFPDPRLAPLVDLARAYRSTLLVGNSYQKLGYGDTKGSLWLRKELAIYLNETRGLAISENNLLIVRGTIMGLYLTSLAFIMPGHKVAIGESSWQSAIVSFQQAGSEIIRVPIDENGIDIDALEKICETQDIRLVYVTSHHNYPTTVILKANRRIKLLQLAQKYQFIIFEDDYDYDFHYQSRPLMPLASADTQGLVLYSGSFTKSISPGFRVGYLVATEDVIDHLANYRRIIDRQGDSMLENAIAQLLHESIIQKHLRKAVKEYKIRRDFFCQKLFEMFPDHIEFQIPEGGMSVWAKFSEKIDVERTAEIALKNGLYFSNGIHHNVEGKIKNYTRLGFASSTTDELSQCLTILKKSLVFK